MEVRVVREDELEPAKCEECGSGNILAGVNKGCHTCTEWHQEMQHYLLENPKPEHGR